MTGTGLQTTQALTGATERTDRFRYGVVAASITLISLVHYTTPLHHPALHDIFQRLYYIPIILAAVWFGFKGGLTASIIISIIYVPHVMFQWGDRLTMELEKYLEIVLYNVVGGITGFLSEREKRYAEELRRTARGLEESCNNLQRQSEVIIELEEQLRRSERLSTLGEMTAVLAHEIRNPLGSIRGTAEILKDDYQPDDRKYEFVEILVKESERLNRVVEDFLRLARTKKTERRSCDLGEELQNVVTLVTAEARRRGVALEFDRAALPPLSGDREKLMQAFLNIVLNGLQATPPGGRMAIRATHDEAAGTLRIAFADSGSGMAADMVERIFEPFYTTKEEGTGLGLAITRKIIEAHGGTIGVESAPGQGTTFVVTLPLPQGEETA